MDVIAYSYQSAANPVELGSIADAIWVNGFKSAETRNVQKSVPMNAAAPNYFDRVTSVQDFSFAASRSFGSAAGGSQAVASALQFLQQHPASVPRIATLQFKQQGGEAWLCYCAIMKVELVRKDSALITFSYTVNGGTWSPSRLPNT